jgi:Mn2+/Fe2+ NRAMP family transporter
VIWAAAITSVVGSAWTSVSFVRTLSRTVDRFHTLVIVGFIVTSTTVFVAVGQPIKLLVLVGALNALILPASLAAMLLASRRRDLMGEYRHPAWLAIAGIVVVIAMVGLGGYTITHELPKVFQ